jgi:exodeoxyribonuclease VII small subunit
MRPYVTGKGSDDKMADEKYTFEQARIRLEEIAAEVRKKDTSLEKSLDLLEEGVRLANICTELVDHTDMSASVSAPGPVAEAVAASEDPEGDGEGDSEAGDKGNGESDDAGDSGAGEADDDESDDESDGFEDADEDIEEPSDTGIDD